MQLLIVDQGFIISQNAFHVPVLLIPFYVLYKIIQQKNKLSTNLAPGGDIL